MSVIRSVQTQSSLRIWGRFDPAMSAKSCPAENTGPFPARMTPSASLSPASRNAWISSFMCARESALRRSGRFIVIVM